VVIGARAKKAKQIVGVSILPAQRPYLPPQFHFREGRGEGKRPGESYLGRQIQEEILDRGDTDGAEHLLFVTIRVGNIFHDL
jgi:hypothetical protein